MLRAQQLADKNATSDKGFAMLVTAVITILLFSLLGAYLTMTDLGKSSASAYVDGSNTFYAAESGLNQRASIVRDRFDGYTVPGGTSPGQVAGVITPAQNIANCFNTTANQGTGDFACRQRNFTSNSSKNIRYDRSDAGGSSYTATNQTDTYTAYSFVADTTQYTAGTTNPVPKVVPQGEDYAGLNVIEYKYTVYATAAKKQGSLATSADAKTVLQMDFKSRTIPLFQFAAFYDGDLEVTSSSNLNLTGRVHTNANLYLQPNINNPAIASVFGDGITAVGRIFRRVDSTLTAATTGSVRLQTGATFLDFPLSDYTTPVPINLTGATVGALSAADSTTFKNRVKDGSSGITSLTTPPAGFLRKRNYYKSAIAANDADRQAAVGTYWAKADMRLEMVPDRDAVEEAGGNGTTPLTAASGVTAINNQAAWNRNEAIIPFNFTSIQAGAGTNLCSVTPPATNTDPVATYVDPGRNGAVAPITGAVTIQCNRFTKGQLQSLRQPVMVLTAINQPDTSIDHKNPAIPGSESKTLGEPTPPTTLPGLSTAANNDTTKTKIIRALQVALASTPKPLALDLMDVKFNVLTLPDISGYGGVNAGAFRAEFSRLINLPAAFPELTAADRTALLAASPSEIAALRSAWFLPAPIQRLSSTSDRTRTTGARTNYNLRSSGFYDGREQRWITMLQTNIESLTVWNRDGLFVEADLDPLTTAENLRQPYSAATALKNTSFNNGIGANFTNNRAFVRGAATTEALGPDNTNLANQFASFQRLGLGNSDATEGGLVFHATVSDDLNGDDDATDVTRATQNSTGTVTTPVSATITPTTAPIPLQLNPDGTTKFYKNANGTNKLDSSGNPIPYTLDYFRQYWEGNARQSPFGFAFSGGDFLPGAMTIATDQAVYIQGDFNNNSAPQTAALPIVAPNPNRLPASILADTITNLSNQCTTTSSAISATNHLGVLAGQIRCGLPRASTGSIDLIVAGNTANFYRVNASTAVNAAYLSYTTRSVGNCAANAVTPVTYTCLGVQTPLQTSGGLNNYMRMLEDWRESRYFNYSGSFVSLGIPTEYSGAYAGGSGGGGTIGDGIGSGLNRFYNIPARNFNFDPNFTSFNRLPPLTPQVQYLQQEVFKRTFN